ncbi:MAG: hypothetical protein CMD26_05900 [Flavobacteriales bacterium]|nr:hypothetical protein [Flavobacteriales bacterium]
MMNYYNHVVVFICSVIYLFFIAYFLKESVNFILLAPCLLAIIFMAIYRFNYVLYIIFFITPLSIPISELGLDHLGLNFAFPTEPILFGLMLLTIWKLSYNFKQFRSIFKHPITLVLLFYLFWILITTFTSSMPLVSFKFFLNRVWYVLPLVFMGVFLFKKPNSISSFVLLYTIALTMVVSYTIIKHANFFFDKHSAHYMMSPFFNDHTSYGAMIAFFLPFNVALFYVHKNTWIRLLSLVMLLILSIGLILSFTRAAWISLFIAFIVFIFLRLKINRVLLFISPVVLSVMLLLFSGSIIKNLETNKQDSSDNLIEHISSMSNISTDASNMERINRWKCALKMFIEKPLYGWGPGTYQFQYSSFQLSKDRTIISSNFGDMGNAHSEYLSALCETGLIGFLSFFSLVLVIVIRAINMYYTANNRTDSIWLLAIVTALISYFIHGLLNNFLDTDKASVAIWCCVSILIAIDLLNNKKQPI